MKALFIISFIFLFGLPTKAFSQSTFSISPTIITGEKSKQVHQELFIQNPTETEIQLGYTIRPFSKNNGQIHFTEPDADYALAITKIRVETTDESITIPPRETLSITVSGDLRELPSRDYYLAVIFNAQATELPEQTTGTMVSAGIAIPLIISTPEYDSSLVLDTYTLPSFILDQSLPLEISVKNVSKSMTVAQSTIEIKNLLGKTIDTLELPKQTILAGSSQDITNQDIHPKRLLVGVYSAHLNLIYDETHISQSRYVAIFPKQLIIPLIALCFITTGLYLRVRKYF
jgi:hypothetical protein